MLMAKKQKNNLQVRDWLLILMGITIVLTNVVWYSHVQSLQTSDKNDATSWLHQQVQINKLKACIDQGTKPCDINPLVQ